MSEDGRISLAAVIDTSPAEQNLDDLEAMISDFTDQAVARTTELQEELSKIGDVDVDVKVSVTDVDTAEQAAAQLNDIISGNIVEIMRLEEEYARLGKEAQSAERIGTEEARTAAQAAKKQQEAVSKLITERKKVVQQAQDEEKALKKVVSQMSVENRVALALRGGLQQMKQLTRELQAEMVALEAAGQRDTQRFKDLAAGAATLTDAMGDARAQVNILANDQAGFAGMVSAISGITGAFSAAQGAISLFGSENEDLQQIMLRVQSLMAITTGLQQVSVMLNKDSAASIVLLNGVKSIWVKLTEALSTAQTEENIATAEAATATATETAAQEAAATATVEATAATIANTEAEQTNAGASQSSAAANTAQTASLEAETTATVTATTATAGLSRGMKLLRLAIISTGIGALIVLIGSLISWISDWMDEVSEAEKRQQALNDAVTEGNKTLAKAQADMGNYERKLKSFNGTKEEEKKLVNELNSKYGEEMGYHKSRAEWMDTLKQKGKSYCEMLALEAKAQAVQNKMIEANVELLEIQQKAKNGEFKSRWKDWYKSSDWKKRSEAERKKEAEDKVKADLAVYEWENERIQTELEKLRNENDFNFHADPNAKNGSQSTFDPKKAAEQVAKAYEDYANYVKQFVKRVNDDISAANIQYMKDGLDKDLKQSQANFDKLKEGWKAQFSEFGQALKQRQHDIFMSKEGATEAEWRGSAEGRKTDDEWLEDALSQNEELAKRYYAQLARLEQQSVTERMRIQQSYTDGLVDQYGTTEEKIALLERRFFDQFNNLGEDDPQWGYLDKVEEALNKQIADLKMKDFKDSIKWEDVFGDLDAVATDSLKTLKEKLQEFVKTQKDLSPESLKSIVEAIERIDEKVNERSPFKALSNDFATLTDAIKEADEAQKAYNKALDEGTEAEKADAKAALDAALNKKQKALADATKSLRAAAGQLGEYLNAANAIVDVMGVFGVELPEQLTGFVNGIGKAIDALASIDLTKPMSVITGAIGAIGGIFSSIGSLFNNDGGHEKQIQKLQKQIDALQESYDSLGKSINKAYGSKAKGLIEDQNKLLQRQKVLIRQQIAEENAKKKTDKDKITAWENQIKEIDALIADNKEKAIDAIFGEDVKSAIDNFADAYASMFDNGMNKAKASKDFVRDMIKKMIVEAMKQDISAPMERLRKKMEEYWTDSEIDTYEEGVLDQMAQQMMGDLEGKYNWADKYFKDAYTQQGGSSGGFQTMSEDTAGELNGRFTAMQIAMESTRSLTEGIQIETARIGEGVTYLRDGMQEMQNIALLQLGQLESINKNTKELSSMSQTLDRIDRNIQNL